MVEERSGKKLPADRIRRLVIELLFYHQSPQTLGSAATSTGQPLKNPNYLVSWHGFTIQIALNLNAAFEVQTSHLLFGLDTFGGGGHAKAHSKPRDGANNSKASFIDEQISDK
jgi:hypothetical protein